MYDLVLYLHPAVAKFPKNERFTLGQEIENQSLYILKLIMRINTIYGERVSFVKELSQEFDVLSTYSHLAYDLRFLSAKQYGLIIEKIGEIMTICQGWLKSSKGKSE